MSLLLNTKSFTADHTGITSAFWSGLAPWPAGTLARP
jgi:hypothetical protein